MSRVVAFVIGVIFATGLVLSGMSAPANVTAFLDVTSGQWNPTLMFVMVSAIGVSAAFLRIAKRRRDALFGQSFSVPATTQIDRPLILGAVIFGAGWGLSGVCPGPGVVGLATLQRPYAIFFASVLVGMALFFVWQRRATRDDA